MKPRRQRWLSLPELLDRLPKIHPKLAERIASRPRKRQLEHLRRLVRRAEQRDAVRFTKRCGGDIYVSVDALEALLPVDTESLAVVEKNLSDLHQRHRGLQRQVNGHGAKLREHSQLHENHRKALEHIAKAAGYLAAR